MLLSALSDAELVSEYLQGREAAFEILIKRHQSRIFSNIYFKVKDEDLANDLFQDVFIKVVNTMRLGKYKEEGKFLPWVLRIAHNLVIDHFRRESKMYKVRTTDDYDPFRSIMNNEENAHDAMVDDQINSDVKELIVHLPKDQQEIIQLRIFKGMSFKDISEMKDISINTALGRMRYALINMRKLIEENNIILTRY
ncbi:MAG: RNA polymerase sigma factor (sigma-70 family) [Patiriisocius sp.]|jgi:RNA polymerase sigma factor (sigma-70 family)